MTSIHPSEHKRTFSQLLTHLKTFPTPLFPPPKPHEPLLSDEVASLYLHPALEALLHLMNHDLPSAHFLVRHLQSPPAYEGMYVHGILHRIEGDFDNARAWYSDVGDFEEFGKFWGLEDSVVEEQGKKMPRQRAAREFLNSVERCLRSGRKEGDRESLERKSRDEIESLVEWCVKKFGTKMRLDATQDWVWPSEEISAKGQDMVSGSDGWRKF